MKRITAAIFFLMLMTISSVEAARIDAYREILLGGRYTIQCENLTPTARITNRTKMELYGKSGLAVDSNDFFISIVAVADYDIAHGAVDEKIVAVDCEPALAVKLHFRAIGYARRRS